MHVWRATAAAAASPARREEGRLQAILPRQQQARIRTKRDPSVRFSSCPSGTGLSQAAVKILAPLGPRPFRVRSGGPFS